jgi:outer membrane protein assembly factor BamB
MRYLLPLLAALVILAGCGSSGSSTSSADPGGVVETSDPGGVVGPQTGKIRWQRRLEGPVVPGPTVGAHGIAYAASNGGVLHAIEVKTGKDVWSFDGGGPYGFADLSTSPALLPGGEVLWPGPGNILFALSSAGKLLWRARLPAPQLSPVVTKDGTVVVADMAGDVEELVPRPHASPTVAWKVALGDTSFGSPALGADGTVYTTTEKALVAIREGKVQWSFPASSPSEVSPAVAPDGTIVFGTNDSEYGVSPQGDEVWRHPNGTRTYSSPVVTADGRVYYGDNRGFVTTLEAGDGKQLSQVGVEQPPGVWTAPSVDARDDVYYGTASGEVFGYDSAGEQLFELKVGAKVDSYPALAGDGTLLIGSENGTLYALG